MSQRTAIRWRLIAMLVFAAIAAIFVFLWAGGTGRMDLSRWLGICGFRQSYGLPCPFCYITHAGEAFAEGRVLEAFYIQPAGGVFCCGLLATGVFALLFAVFGIDFPFLHRRLNWQTVKYFIVSVIIIVGAGWAVTLARTLAKGR